MVLWNMQEYTDFILKTIGTYSGIEPLAGDASSRRYFRLSSETKKLILCVDNADNKSISSFIKIHNLFSSHKVRVPHILAVDEPAGFMILEDLGDVHLETCLTQKPLILNLYYKSLDALMNIQSIRGDEGIPFNLFFDVEKLMYEFDFFIEHFLKGFRKSDISNTNKLRSSFEKIAEALQSQNHFVTTHRDYHSRNIIVNEGEPCIIDFQDARMGLPQYDLVSLLEDPYASLQGDVKQKLRDYYYEKASEKKIIKQERAEFDRTYDLMAFQRLIKAMGTYGYMATVKNKPNYITYVDGTILNLDSFASRHAETANSWALLKVIF